MAKKTDNPQAHIGIINVKNEAGKSSTLELYFTDYIYDSYDWWTGESTNMVQDTIDQVNAAKPTSIKIIINSLGGDVGIGLALYNFLKNYNAEKEVEIIGYAASIASIMAMCATKGKLKMAKTSFMVVHAAWTVAAGNAKEIRQQADTLDKITEQLADVYANRSGKKPKYFTDLWENGDYWITPEEALSIGVCDEIFNSDVDEMQAAACIDFSKYKFQNVPAALMQAKPQPPAPVDDTNLFSKIKDYIMGQFNTMFNTAVADGKKDDKFKDVADRDKILDMVASIMNPIMDKIDAALPKAETAPAAPEAPAETPAAPVVEKKPAETPAPAAPVETPTPAATEKKDEAPAENAALVAIQAKLDQMEKDNAALRAAVAGKAGLPEPATTGNASNKAAKAKLEYM